MPFKIGGKGGGSSSLSVRNTHIFADNTTRDDYFSTNPSQLTDNLYITVGADLQKYVDGSWEVVSAIIKGAAGTPAPELQIEYSFDGSTGWTETLNPILHKYWRWSTDGGDNWSANGVRFNASGSGITPQQEADIVSNNTARHTHSNKSILDNTTGTFTAARQTKLDGVQDTWKGVFTSAIAINTAFPTPTDGWACWNTSTSTVWGASGGVWADTLASSVGDMLQSTYDPQGIASDTFNRTNHSGNQAISTITGLQTELNKIPTIQSDISDLDDQLNNTSSGLVKVISDVDTKIEGNGGIKDRLDDLETGGTATMKLRTHSPSGVYEDGELVQKDNKIYKSNNTIDGSTTAVNFVEGTGANQWTELSPNVKPYALGDVKASMQILDHNGWYLLDGRLVNSLPASAQVSLNALGYTAASIPNSAGRHLTGASTANARLGATYGSTTIARNNLPNVSIASGTESQGHTHNVDPASATTSKTFDDGKVPQWVSSGNNFGTYRVNPDTNGSLYLVGRGSDVTLESTPLGHTHTLNIPSTTSSDRNQAHTHTVSLNGGVTQEAYNAPQIQFNFFIYLG